MQFPGFYLRMIGLFMNSKAKTFIYKLFATECRVIWKRK